MSDNNHMPRRVTAVEILPPASSSISIGPEISNLPQGLFGMSFLARARYASETRQFECYTRLVRAKIALVAALNEQQKLLEQYLVQSERLRNLDDIREAARIQVRRELASTKNQAELEQLRADEEKARLRNQIARHQKEHDALIKPAPERTSVPSQTMADRLKRAAGEIEELNAAHQEIRNRWVAEAGGEDNLPEKTCDFLSNWDLVRSKLAQDAMTDLFG